MKRIAPCALLLFGLVLLAPLPGRTTTAIDEALAEAARMGRAAEAAAPDAAAFPDVAAPPPAAEPSYGEALTEPDALESALRALAPPATPPRALPSGAGSALAGSGATGGFLLEAPVLDGDSGGQTELVPAELSSELGLPAPVDVAPR